MAPKGWDRLRPGQCYGIKTPLGSPRYVYAESSHIHQGGIREWSGSVPLCVSSEPFLADATISCELQDLESRLYLAVDPLESRTTLVEPDNYKSKAEIAGVQRLLKDNGYAVSRIDGLSGRKTAQFIAKYRKAADLPPEIDKPTLIDALADSAAQKQTEIGVQICNRTTAKIWAALATRQDGAWESRGWWEVDQEDCVRPFTQSLIGTDAHFFALQEHISEEGAQPDRKLRSVATTPTQFCVAESRFAALGREYCAEAGYAVANFRPLPTEQDGTSITLTDQDFVTPSVDGLRR